MIAGGVTVLMIASLDSASGAAVIKKAAASGIPVIDYDRLTLGGGAKYYVSFDNVAVGAVIGQGLVKGLQAAGKKTGTVIELNGSPTDNNATLFRQGYDQVIQQAGYRVVGSQPVPGWDGPMAVTVFSRMLADAGGNVDGVAAANDVLGGSAVSVLTTEGAAGKVVVTGQDATDAGLQRLLLGTQYVTVYKAIKLEASAAAKLAVALIKGDSAGADAQASGTITDSSTRVDVKSVLLKPKAIYKQNVKEVVADGYTTAAKLCTTPQLKAACAANGIS
jgi:D-xylose transport system substrate-binding protein